MPPAGQDLQRMPAAGSSTAHAESSLAPGASVNPSGWHWRHWAREVAPESGLYVETGQSEQLEGRALLRRTLLAGAAGLAALLVDAPGADDAVAAATEEQLVHQPAIRHAVRAHAPPSPSLARGDGAGPITRGPQRTRPALVGVAQDVLGRLAAAALLHLVAERARGPSVTAVHDRVPVRAAVQAEEAVVGVASPRADDRCGGVGAGEVGLVERAGLVRTQRPLLTISRCP
eukprot:1243768-Rhodomonas_salina.2